MARASRNEAGLEIRPGRKPNTRGKRQSRVCFRRLWLRTGDHNIVRCVGFAVGAEGAEGITVWLAFVFIRPVPWIYTDHTREIARAEMIDQDLSLIHISEPTRLLSI